MSVQAIIMMVAFASIIWGGFLFASIRLIRISRQKNKNA